MLAWLLTHIPKQASCWHAAHASMHASTPATWACTFNQASARTKCYCITITKQLDPTSKLQFICMRQPFVVFLPSLLREKERLLHCIVRVQVCRTWHATKEATEQIFRATCTSATKWAAAAEELHRVDHGSSSAE